MQTKLDYIVWFMLYSTYQTTAPSSTCSTMGRRSEQQLSLGQARPWLWRDKRTLGSDSFLCGTLSLLLTMPAVAFLGTCSWHLESKLKNKPLPLIIMKTMEPGNVYILWNDENLLPETGQESSGNDAAAKDTGEKEFGINSKQTAPDEQQIPQKTIIWGFH